MTKDFSVTAATKDKAGPDGSRGGERQEEQRPGSGQPPWAVKIKRWVPVFKSSLRVFSGNLNAQV
jgi:hypothetical protein